MVGLVSSIRVVAVCVFRRGSQILVGCGYDTVKEESFYRPLGGSVEFGERAVEAIRREIREELQAEISEPTELGFIETIFTCDGHPGHEYVVIFDATFEDETLYDLPALPLFEECWGGEARWLDLSEPLSTPLYPEGLEELLRAAV